MNYIIDEFIINEFNEKYNLNIKNRYIEKFGKRDTSFCGVNPTS